MYEVIIIGGGMVGATLGCALGMAGIRVAVIEGLEATPFSHDDDYELRVSAINRASQHLFEHLGVWTSIVQRRVSPFREMHVWDATGGGQIHFDAAELGEPDLGHIVENRVIQAALIERLQSLNHARWICPVSLKGVRTHDDHIQVELDDDSVLRASLLVGADGARSKVRACAGIATRGRSYGQSAVVATVDTENPHEETAWQRFMPSGPLAFLPLADGRSSIVWSTSHSHARALQQMSDEAFRSALEQAFEARLGKIVGASRRIGFELRGFQASRYVRSRIALVGDAAHVIHPLAGQGVNLGAMDAATLAEVLLAGPQDLGSERTLRRYERARRGHDLLMMRAMEAFNLLFGNELAPVRWLRNRGLNWTNAAAPVKHRLMRFAMGLDGELPALAGAVYPEWPPRCATRTTNGRAGGVPVR